MGDNRAHLCLSSLQVSSSFTRTTHTMVPKITRTLRKAGFG